MNCKKVAKIVSDYLIDDVDDATRSAIEVHLSDCADCRREVESLKSIWMKLGNLPEEDPTPRVRTRFDAMLEAYIAGQGHAKPGWRETVDDWLERFWPKRPVWQFGIAMASLVVGLFVGGQIRPEVGHSDLTQLRSEVHDLRQIVATALLQNQSSTERLRGVSYSYQIDRPDDETLTALLNTLNYDPNINVRLAAIDALSNFYDKREVRRGFIESLSRQTSPLVQIALIDLLARMREINSIETLKFLEQNETFNPTVRRRAGTAIEQIQ